MILDELYGICIYPFEINASKLYITVFYFEKPHALIPFENYYIVYHYYDEDYYYYYMNMFGYTLALRTKMFSNHRTKIIDFVIQVIFAVICHYCTYCTLILFNCMCV